MTVFQLTAEERDAIYVQSIERLSAIDSVFVAVEAKEFEKARHLSTEIADDLALIDRLGWADPPSREAVELSLPNEQLHRLFTRLRADAEAIQEDSDQEEAEAAEQASGLRLRSQRVATVSGRVLAALGGTPRET